MDNSKVNPFSWFSASKNVIFLITRWRISWTRNFSQRKEQQLLLKAAYVYSVNGNHLCHDQREVQGTFHRSTTTKGKLPESILLDYSFDPDIANHFASGISVTYTAIINMAARKIYRGHNAVVKVENSIMSNVLQPKGDQIMTKATVASRLYLKQKMEFLKISAIRTTRK